MESESETMAQLKRIAAAAMAAAMALSAAGCSGADKSWAVKDSTDTVAIGSYIYNLYSAYSTASSKVTDSSKKVLEQKIDNEDAASWIRAKALSDTKALLLTEQKMKEMKLSLSDSEKSQAKSAASSAWSSYSSTLEKYGIAQSSFQATVDAVYKEDKIFNALYGKGGSKAVSDGDLKDFYTKNYTSFAYLYCPLYTTDSNGNYKASLSDADKKKAEQQFGDYASQIKAGKMTMQQAADAYKKSINSSSDQLNSETVNLTTDTSYPDALKKALADMKSGEIRTLELTTQAAYLLIEKNDIEADADTKLKTDSGRSGILRDYKWEEFNTAFEKEADAMTGVTVNENAINSYNPSMFES